ncbi:MAG: hypothetical protein GH155_06865 [Spirochaeta sp.]|nr:hypothetical protein [Spirochaeta sp.]
MFLLTFSLFAEWRTLKSQGFTIFYQAPEGEKKALEVIKILEYHHSGMESLLGNSLKRTPVVLEDLGAFTNGLADPVFNSIHLFPYPPSTGALSFAENSWTQLGIHEYAHMLHLTAAGGVPAFITSIFGNIAAPNLLAPLWLMEGIAVYAESRLSEYSGRLNEGAFSAYMAARTGEYRFPSLAEATFEPASYPGSRGAYLFGAKFIDYLLRTYGEDKLALFINQYGASPLAYISPLIPALGLDRTAKRVFGKSFHRLWRDWQRSEEIIFIDYKKQGKQVTPVFWEIENPLVHNGKLYYQRSYALKTSVFDRQWHYELVEQDLDSCKTKKLVSSTSPFSGPLRIHRDKLYYLDLGIETGFANIWYRGYGFTTRLHQLDLKSGKEKVVLKEQIRAFDLLPGGEVIYARDRAAAFGSELYLFEQGRKGSEPQLLLESELLIGEILAASEHIYLSARRDCQNFSLYSLEAADLQNREGTEKAAADPLIPLIETPYRESALSLYKDLLLFSANYWGEYSLYGYNTQNRELYRLHEGGYSPVIADEELYYVAVSSDGKALYRTESWPERTSFLEFPAQEAPQMELPEIKRGGYLDSLATLLPRVRYPLLAAEITGDSMQVMRAGAGIMGISALGDIQYLLETLYNFNDQVTEIDLSLETKIFNPLLLSFALTTVEEYSLESRLEFPLYRSINNGLGELAAGAAATCFETDFSRLSFTPFLFSALQFPWTSVDLWFQSTLERRDFGSSEDLTGFFSDLRISRRFTVAAAGIDCSWYYALDRARWQLPPIRGYLQGPLSQSAVLFSLDLSLPIFKLRGGLWNPSIYFEDIFLVPFFDICLAGERQVRYSMGAEIHLEIKALSVSTGLPLDGYLSFAVNREEEISIFLGLKSPLSAGDIFRQGQTLVPANR